MDILPQRGVARGRGLEPPNSKSNSRSTMCVARKLSQILVTQQILFKCSSLQKLIKN